jgi:hypothetical protein
MSAMPVLLIKIKTALTRRSAAKAEQPPGLRPPLRRGSNASQALEANDPIFSLAVSKGDIPASWVTLPARAHLQRLPTAAGPWTSALTPLLGAGFFAFMSTRAMAHRP